MLDIGSHSLEHTVFGCSWVPSSPRLVAVGCSLTGEGRVVILTLQGQGISQLDVGVTEKAVRCGTFSSSSVEDRQLVTGDFGGNIEVWDMEEIAEGPVQSVRGHDNLINNISGDLGRVVTGGRDGKMKVWDRRDLGRAKVAMEGGGKHDCWSVDISGDLVVGGFSNGDIRLFDLRKVDKALWEVTNRLGGVTSLEMEERELVVGGMGGGIVRWEGIGTNNVVNNEVMLEKGTAVWSARSCPQNRGVVVGGLGSGAIQVVGRDSKQLGDRPVTGLAWSGDKGGLLACTSFDQTVRVMYVTDI